MRHPKVCITIVTYNSSRYIRRCLEAVLRQEGVTMEVVVVDNASTDDTREILKEFKGRIRKLLHDKNLGFAEAQNRAIRLSRSEWVLTLNPDVLLLPGFVRMLVEAGEANPHAGSVCGKLLSIAPGFEFLPEPRIDSTGIFFTPAMRHFDRGWHQPDTQCFESMEYVFGASAAAALFRRRMVDDIVVEGSFFDPAFFIYREDADVAWRAQLMGWRCIYTPSAAAYHVRTANPENRRSVPAAINIHSVKNRFLMRIKNATPGLYRRYWVAMTLRDLVVLGGVLFWEPSSLPALWRFVKCVPRAWRQRRDIMRRRKVDDEVMTRWFSVEPAAQPLDSAPAPIPASGLLEPAVTLAGRST